MMSRFVFLGLSVLALACEKQGEPTTPPSDRSEPGSVGDESSTDPLAGLGISDETVPEPVVGPDTFDGCHSDKGMETIEIVGKVEDQGQPKEFKGCNPPVMTPFTVRVAKVKSGKLEAGGTITVWDFGGEITRPDGKRVSGNMDRSCGRIPAAGKNKPMCVVKAGPDFTIECCAWEGDRETKYGVPADAEFQ